MPKISLSFNKLHKTHTSAISLIYSSVCHYVTIIIIIILPRSLNCSWFNVTPVFVIVITFYSSGRFILLWRLIVSPAIQTTRHHSPPPSRHVTITIIWRWFAGLVGQSAERGVGLHALHFLWPGQRFWRLLLTNYPFIYLFHSRRESNLIMGLWCKSWHSTKQIRSHRRVCTSLDPFAQMHFLLYAYYSQPMRPTLLQQ